MDQNEQMVRMYYDDILRYFIVRIRDRSCAEDLTQETFLRWIRYGNKPSFAAEQQRKAYLYRIASRVCVDYVTAGRQTEELDENLPAPTGNEDLSLTLEWALSRLPDPQREAALLYYYSGFKVREIAGIQNVTVSAVKSRLKLARDTLRHLLTEQEEI